MKARTCYLDHYIFVKGSTHEFGVLLTVAVIKITQFKGKAQQNRCVLMTENEYSDNEVSILTEFSDAELFNRKLKQDAQKESKHPDK